MESAVSRYQPAIARGRGHTVQTWLLVLVPLRVLGGGGRWGRNLLDRSPLEGRTGCFGCKQQNPVADLRGKKGLIGKIRGGSRIEVRS